MRDTPEGKSRRSSLRHWVSEHMRRQKGGDENEASIKVREHLRGSLDFNWLGLEATVFPSPYDLERNEELRRLAAESRRRRKAKRR
jgi:hypothetical protein